LSGVENDNYLAEFVAEQLRLKNLSTYDVARRSGNKINAATVNKIMNGEIRSSGVKTLDALADGLGVNRREVYNAARGIDNDMPERFQTYAERFDAGDLTHDEWSFLEMIFADDIRHFRQQRERMKVIDLDAAKAEGKVAATITPPNIESTNVMVRGEMTADEIQRELDAGREVLLPPKKRSAR
jgi:transcriptional regulator with XRE-family HTH domain